MTIAEIRMSNQELKDAWLEYLVSEMYDYEGKEYIDSLHVGGATADTMLAVFEQQGYWAGVVRRYYWFPEMLTFITEGR